MILRVGLIGLGIMGSAYAGHLIDAGFPTTAYDVDPAALERYKQRGGNPAVSAKGVAANSDVIVVALASANAVEAALFGADGVANGVSAGSVILDMGTFPLELKRNVKERLLGHGATVLDTPVSGTGSQAATRDLVVFASGDRGAFEKARAALDALARDVRYVGEFGKGSKLKYIANLLVTIHNLSTAEAMVLAEKAGIDGKMLLDMLGESAASSRMFQVRGPMMAAHTYEPATMRLEVYQKDLEIIDAFAKSLDCPTPLFSASLPYYAGAISDGRGKQDTAAIVSVLRERAGLVE
ncbi:MAG TPA: NAD(P)-dependent oxidoreductase [Candidatus Baltobacteraceae bacterium]|jgi:3-hydroxyisobutyrate dehydrogenase-like beta-hydroxyacid dehydrogenase